MKSNTNQSQPKLNEDQLSSTAVVMWMEQDVLRRLAGECKSLCINSNDGSGIGCSNKGSKTGAVGRGVALAASTRNWWSQLKTAGAAIYANRHYLALRQQRQQLTQQESLPLSSSIKCILTKADNEDKYLTIGHVYVHPSAQVHPTALVSTFIFIIFIIPTTSSQ